MTPSGKETPKRYRSANANAWIETIQATIEEEMRLPEGSVRLVYPSGRKARSDATVGSLRRRWANRS